MIRIQVQAIQGGLLQIPVIVAQNRDASRLDVKVCAETEWELHPTRNQDSTKMTVGDDRDIASSNTVFQIFPVDLLHLFDDTVDTSGHIIRAFSSRTSGPPDRPVLIPCFDLIQLQAFVVPVVPFADFLGDFMRW